MEAFDEKLGNDEWSYAIDKLPDKCCITTPLSIALDQAQRVGKRKVPVLISGETGTGKEILAKIIHLMSKVPDSPFIPVNCGAINPNLAESEFFGHARGSFSGALNAHVGYFEKANDGTIFLDEVGELSLNIQVKLLRVLQEKAIVRVGENKERSVTARVIAATNRDLADMVNNGTFREDLYYRLNIFPISIQPIRTYPEDIPPLADFLLKKICADECLDGMSLSKNAEWVLRKHLWPGNVRELLGILTRACILSDENTIPGDLLEEALGLAGGSEVSSTSMGSITDLKELMAHGQQTLAMLGTCRESEFFETLNTLGGINPFKDWLDAFVTLAALLESDGNKASAGSLINIKHTSYLYKLDRAASFFPSFKKYLDSLRKK